MKNKNLKESKFLRLSSKFAKLKIGWSAKLNIVDSLKNTIEWYIQANKKMYTIILY